LSGGVLGSEPIFFSSLSLKEDKATASEEIFPKVKEVETLLDECLVI